MYSGAFFFFAQHFLLQLLKASWSAHDRTRTDYLMMGHIFHNRLTPASLNPATVDSFCSDGDPRKLLC
jgi:hypothetical protein